MTPQQQYQMQQEQLAYQANLNAMMMNSPQMNGLLDLGWRGITNNGIDSLSDSHRMMLQQVAGVAVNSFPVLSNLIPTATEYNNIYSGLSNQQQFYRSPIPSFFDAYKSANSPGLADTAAIMQQQMHKATMTGSGGYDFNVTSGLGGAALSQIMAMMLENDSARNLTGGIISQGLGDGSSAQFIQNFQTLRNTADLSSREVRQLEYVGEILKTQEVLKGQGKDKEEIDKRIKEDYGDLSDFSSIMQMVKTTAEGDAQFTAAGKELKDVVKKTISGISENVKMMSEIFGTEDVRQLQEYADVLRIGALTDVSKSTAVTKEINELKERAYIGGVTVQQAAQMTADSAAMYADYFGGIDKTPTSYIRFSDRMKAHAAASGLSPDEQLRLSGEDGRSAINAHNLYKDVSILDGLAQDASVNPRYKIQAAAIATGFETAAAQGDTDAMYALAMRARKLTNTIDPTLQFDSEAQLSYQNRSGIDLPRLSIQGAAPGNVSTYVRATRGLLGTTSVDDAESMILNLLGTVGGADRSRGIYDILRAFGRGEIDKKAALERLSKHVGDLDYSTEDGFGTQIMSSVGAIIDSGTGMALMASGTRGFTNLKNTPGTSTSKAEDKAQVERMIADSKNKTTTMDPSNWVANLVNGLLSDGSGDHLTQEMKNSAALSAAMQHKGITADQAANDLGGFRLGEMDSKKRLLLSKAAIDDSIRSKYKLTTPEEEEAFINKVQTIPDFAVEVIKHIASNSGKGLTLSQGVSEDNTTSLAFIDSSKVENLVDKRKKAISENDATKFSGAGDNILSVEVGEDGKLSRIVSTAADSVGGKDGDNRGFDMTTEEGVKAFLATQSVETLRKIIADPGNEYANPSRRALRKKLKVGSATKSGTAKLMSSMYDWDDTWRESASFVGGSMSDADFDTKRDTDKAITALLRGDFMLSHETGREQLKLLKNEFGGGFFSNRADLYDEEKREAAYKAGYLDKKDGTYYLKGSGISLGTLGSLEGQAAASRDAILGMLSAKVEEEEGYEKGKKEKEEKEKEEKSKKDLVASLDNLSNSVQELNNNVVNATV